MRKLSLLLLLLFVAGGITAQSAANQANNWHFGNGLAISFTNAGPVLNPPSSMVAFEGVVSMSDTTGQLLFYTNGGGRPFNPLLPTELRQSTGIIWNRNHAVLYDMRGEEGGGYSSRQSAISFPDPSGEAGVYYLFTMEESDFASRTPIPGQPRGRGLSYFIIDMALNGGLGGVRQSEQQLFVPAYEGLDAVPTAKGDGYWVVCHSEENGAKFLVTQVQGFGVSPTLAYPVTAVDGKIEFSPDGQYLLNNDLLYAFDAESGAIASDPFELSGIDSEVASFTPDSRFLYTIENRGIIGNVLVRYDLLDLTARPLAITPLRNPATQASVRVTAPIQIGPNGNLYFLEQGRTTAGDLTYGLSEITCVSSPEPTVNRYLIDLPISSTDGFLPQSLPQYVDAIFATEFVPDTIVLPTTALFGCAGDELMIVPRETGTSYRWSTGAETTTISVVNPGEYCVTISGGGCSPTVDCQTVAFDEPAINPVVIVDQRVTACEPLRCLVDLDVTGAYEGIRIILFRDNPVGAPVQVAELFTPLDTVTLNKPGPDERYQLIVSFVNCGQLTYPLTLDFPEDDRYRPELDVTADGSLCNGLDVTIEVVNEGGTGIGDVRWFDGNTDNPRTLPARFETEYEVTVFSECGDSTSLVFDDFVEEFCDCRGEIPELITPNGDGVNDEFRLYTNCPPEDYDLRIYNRWGQLVFATSNPNDIWDGNRNGTPQEMGMYLYRMAFRFPGGRAAEVRDGAFSLVR
jgi:gliding motility-associated-like protein